MKNNSNLSPRADKALTILADGGQFCRRLERNGYTGREQFAFRLFDVSGTIVKGFGVSVFYELDKAGFLSIGNTTSVSSYYRMNRAA